MNNDNIAVVVMDMQRRFLNRLQPLEEEPLINSQLEVLDFCSITDIPVIVMEYVLENAEYEIIPDPTIERLKTKTEKIPRTKYLRRYYFGDESNDGFEFGGLKDALKSFNPTYVCFMGIAASACVKKTAESTSKAGYEILTASTLIADEMDNIGLLKSHQWYKRAGLFFNDNHSIIEYIAQIIK